jgi:predicted nucleic acid-binding protein
MVICCDTSFLFSVYGNDANTPRAHSYLKKFRTPLTVSVLNAFELANALRLAEFRQLMLPGHSEMLIREYQRDMEEGRIVEYPCDLAALFKKAHRLSQDHTLSEGHRGFDILHVAAALEMGAEEFLSFDRLQSRLAHAVQMRAPLKQG